jgi:hypothetical protein
MTLQNTKNATSCATLSTDEAAAYLGIAPSSLSRARLTGFGPRFCKLSPSIKARVVYRREDLDAWLETRARTSTSEYAAA